MSRRPCQASLARKHFSSTPRRAEVMMTPAFSTRRCRQANERAAALYSIIIYDWALTRCCAIALFRLYPSSRKISLPDIISAFLISRARFLCRGVPIEGVAMAGRRRVSF